MAEGKRLRAPYLPSGLSEEDRLRLRGAAMCLEGHGYNELASFIRELVARPASLGVDGLVAGLAWALDWIEREGQAQGFDPETESDDWNGLADARAALSNYRAEGER